MKQITHLIPVSKFIIDTVRSAEYSGNELINILYRYSLFVSSPLELGMFIPVHPVSGEVLKEPVKPHTYASENADGYIKSYQAELGIYQQAQENVLFEGFEVIDSSNRGYKGYRFKIVEHEYAQIEYNITTKRFFAGLETIEDLLTMNIKLTPAALKEIYNT